MHIETAGYSSHPIIFINRGVTVEWRIRLILLFTSCSVPKGLCPKAIFPLSFLWENKESQWQKQSKLSDLTYPPLNTLTESNDLRLVWTSGAWSQAHALHNWVVFYVVSAAISSESCCHGSFWSTCRFTWATACMGLAFFPKPLMLLSRIDIAAMPA